MKSWRSPFNPDLFAPNIKALQLETKAARPSLNSRPASRQRTQTPDITKPTTATKSNAEKPASSHSKSSATHIPEKAEKKGDVIIHVFDEAKNGKKVSFNR
jgi:hypothetical protein